MFIEFSEDCQKIFIQAKKEMLSLKHSYIGSEHFLLAILKDREKDISIRLSKYGITYEKFRLKLIDLVGYGEKENCWFLYTPLLKRVIEDTILDAKDKNYKVITLEGIFLSMLEEGEGIAIRILMSLGLSIDHFYNEYSASLRKNSRRKNKNNFLEEYGTNLVEKAKKDQLDPTIGREDEIVQIIETLLRRKKNNPLLIGPAGVGKTAVVEELARRIAEGSVPTALKNKKIISLSMASLISGTKYRGEFEERMNKLIKEVETSQDYILFIDEIHTLVGAGGAEGAIDASNILKPKLSRGNFCLIGATTEKEYDRFISNDKALERRFQVISITEPDIEKTVSILEKIKDIYENFYNLMVPSSILKSLVLLSNQYLHQNKQPDKAIELLDSSCCHASLAKDKKDEKISSLEKDLKRCNFLKKSSIQKNDFKKAQEYLVEEKRMQDEKDKLATYKGNHTSKKLTLKDIIFVLEKKSGIYMYPYHSKRLSLFSKLSSKVIGQDKVLKEISEETEQRLYHTDSYARPLSFLFVGPSGVGKTYTAEVYHKILYSSNPFLRLDMSEYKESHTISKIIGSPAGYVGYGDGNDILSLVSKHPHTVLLLDEIEKAHPSVLNLFLQILDNGVIKNSKGDEISFKHTTIIMTSNLGFSKNSMGFYNNQTDYVNHKLKEFLSVELLNRIQKVCVFNKLSDQAVDSIIRNVWNEERKKHSWSVPLTKKIKAKILEESEINLFGARRLSRRIEKEFRNRVISR